MRSRVHRTRSRDHRRESGLTGGRVEVTGCRVTFTGCIVEFTGGKSEGRQRNEVERFPGNVRAISMARKGALLTQAGVSFTYTSRCTLNPKP
jgi:hypothetical protein